VPRDAVVSRGGRDVVFELRDGRAHLEEVVLGAQRSDQVVVESGLSGGERLVAKPPEALNDGDAVRVEES
jgi:hypothetical protein